jgi:hypothetical protein
MTTGKEVHKPRECNSLYPCAGEDTVESVDEGDG